MMKAQRGEVVFERNYWHSKRLNASEEGRPGKQPVGQKRGSCCNKRSKRTNWEALEDSKGWLNSLVLCGSFGMVKTKDARGKETQTKSSGNSMKQKEEEEEEDGLKKKHY